MHINKSLVVLASSLLLLTSCKQKGWSVDGRIDNLPADAKVAIEGLNGNIWYNIDSVAVGADGSFSYKAAEGAPYPDIYRIGYEGRSIYFPVDSLDHITITADAKSFDSGYTLAGSDLAVRMMQIDAQVADVVAKSGVDAALADSLLKRSLSQEILNDNSGILAYYIINKTVGGKPLFSDNNRFDVNVLGAIATKFDTNFPDNPRTEGLRQRFINAKKAFTVPKNVIEAGETGIFDIELYDEKGQKRALTDQSKTGVTLLSFTSYLIDSSLAYNSELNKVLEAYGNRGVSIYQVSFDTDEVQWRTTAGNLPWTTVHCPSADAARVMLNYNLDALPTTFIIANGDIVERIDDPTKLKAAVARY